MPGSLRSASSAANPLIERNPLRRLTSLRYTIAWARRLTSEPRFSRSASIGRPGRSSSVNSQAMHSRSSYPPSCRTVSSPGRPLTTRPSWMNAGRAPAGRRRATAPPRPARGRGSSCAPSRSVTPSARPPRAQSSHSGTRAARSASARREGLTVAHAASLSSPGRHATPTPDAGPRAPARHVRTMGRPDPSPTGAQEGRCAARSGAPARATAPRRATP